MEPTVPFATGVASFLNAFGNELSEKQKAQQEQAQRYAFEKYKYDLANRNNQERPRATPKGADPTVEGRRFLTKLKQAADQVAAFTKNATNPMYNPQLFGLLQNQAKSLDAQSAAEAATTGKPAPTHMDNMMKAAQDYYFMHNPNVKQYLTSPDTLNALKNYSQYQTLYNEYQPVFRSYRITSPSGVSAAQGQPLLQGASVTPERQPRQAPSSIKVPQVNQPEQPQEKMPAVPGNEPTPSATPAEDTSEGQF